MDALDRVETVDYTGINFPVKSNQYNKIVKQNNINMNVYEYEEEKPNQVHISREECNDEVNLLLTAN